MTEDLQTNERVIRRRPRSRLEPLSVNIRELALEDISDVFELGQKLFTPEKLPTL